MDVYGSNPKIHKGTKKPDRPEDLHKGASRTSWINTLKNKTSMKIKIQESTSGIIVGGGDLLLISLLSIVIG